MAMLIDLGINAPRNYPYKYEGEHVSTMYFFLKSLAAYDTKNYKKVSVRLTLKDEEKNIIERLLDVIVIHKVFDNEKYNECSNNYDKKKMWLDLLFESIVFLAQEEGWDTVALVEAYNHCIDQKLEYTWLRKDKYFRSPDRKYYGGVFNIWDIDRFESYAVFLDKEKTEIGRLKLFDSSPWDVEPMGKMGWDKDSGELYMYSKDGKKRWAASPPEMP